MKFAWIVPAIVMVCVPVHAAGPNDILGKWLDQDKKAQIQIDRCDDRYCGNIVWLKEPNYPADDKKGMAGQPKVDRENPDPAKQNKPLLGLVMVWNFRYTGDSLWEDGYIYDPNNGKTYKCKATLGGPDLLKLRGFIGISLIGRTSEWTRVR